MEKWLNFSFSTGCEPGKDYLAFEAAARKALKKIAGEANFDLRAFHKGHYEFSAVLASRETGKFVYVSISDVRYFPNEWYTNVLIRTMAHEKDWIGGPNHRCEWPMIGTYASHLCV